MKHFADIANNGMPGDDFSVQTQNWDNIFQPIFTKKLFVVKPVANVLKLDITFCLPPLVKVSVFLEPLFHLIKYFEVAQ